MPTYVYKCKAKGHKFEMVQSIKDEPIKKCIKCDSPVERLIFAPTVLVKRDLMERTGRGDFNTKPGSEDDWGSEDLD